MLCVFRSKLPLLGSPSRNAAMSPPNGCAAAVLFGPLTQLELNENLPSELP